MENVKNTSQPQHNYAFIDSIRCIAIIAIVAQHSVAAGGYSFFYGSDLYWSYLLTMQFTKVGTIIFCLLAGFLIGEKIDEYSPWQYLRRRLKVIFWPWVFWSLLYVLIDILLLLFRKPFAHHPSFNMGRIWHNIEGLYLYSSYWFVINFMISICILLAFKKYIRSYVFGAILGCFTLFYSVNIYFEWISPNHTRAILGFVFFLWLGVKLNENWKWAERMIAKIPYAVLIIFILIFYGSAVRESVVLYDISKDPSNPLRVTNIIYTLLCFILLLKIRTFRSLEQLDPRHTTYGIYLIHFILIVFVVPKLYEPFGLNVYELTARQFLIFRLSFFVITYTLTFFIVKMILRSKLKVLIGA